MSRLLTLVLAGALVLGACGSGDTGGGLDPLAKNGGGPASGSGGAGLGGTQTGAGGAPTGSVGPTLGGSPVGTGGGSNTGGVGAGTTGTGGSANDPAFYTSGVFHGYMWSAATGTGSTITPADFSKGAVGGPYCATGSVGAMADYSGVGMVGYNINQTQGSTVVNTWTPTGTGIIVNISNPASSPLRVQIQGPNGATDPNDRWCTNISTFNQDVLLEWAFFSTQCWSGATAPVYYNGTSPLTAVIALVPGTNTTSVPFNFCINKIALAGGGGGTGGTGSGTGTGGSGANLQGSGTLTAQYDWQIGSRDGKQYVVQNNVWGTTASQSVTWRGNTFQVTAQAGTGDTSGAPASYPSAFIGSNYQRTTQGSGLPKLVSSLATVQSSATWASNGASGTYNAAYDIWFSTGSAGDAGAPTGGYVMVWLYKPSGAQPIGSPVGNFSYGGTAYQVWYGTNNGRPCVSFVATGTVNSFTGDLNLFIKEATRLAYIPATWYLTNVFFGFEIWSGGVGLALTDFYVNVT